MKPTIHFETPETTTEDKAVAKSDQARTQQTIAHTLNKPGIWAAGLSLLWLVALIGWALWQGWRLELQNLSSMASLVSLALAPLLLIWLITATIGRQSLFHSHRERLKGELNHAFSPVDAADAKIRLMINRVSSTLDQLDMAAGGAADRVSALESSFKAEVGHLFTAAADADARALAMRDSLRRETQALNVLNQDLSDRLARMEERFEALRETVMHSTTQAHAALENSATLLDGSGDRIRQSSDAAEERLDLMNTRLEEVRRSGEQSISSLEERITAMCDGLSHRLEMLDTQAQTLEHFCHGLSKTLEVSATTLSQATAKATDGAYSLEQIFSQQRDSLSRTADQAFADAHKAGEAIREQIAHARLALSQTLDTAHGEISGFTAQLEAELERVPDRVESTLDAAFLPLNSAQKVLNAQLQDLTAEARRTRESFGDSADAIGQHALDRAKRLEEAGARLQTLIQHLNQSADAAADRLSDQSQTIETQTESLSALHTRLSDAMTQSGTDMRHYQELMEQTVQVAHARYTAIHKDAMTVIHGIQEGEKLLEKELSRIGQLGLQSAEIYEQQRKALRSYREGLEADLSTHSRRMNGLIDEIAKRQGTFVEDAMQNSGKISQMGEALHTRILALDDATQSVTGKVEQSLRQLHDGTRSLNTATAELCEGADSVAHRLQERLTRSIGKGVEASAQALDQLADVYRARFARITDQTGQNFIQAADALLDASGRIQEQGGATAETLKKGVDELVLSAQGLETRMQQLEAVANKTESVPFAKNAGLILDKLASDSIDVTKALSEDIPDDAWARYLEGDKSRFVRQIHKLGTPQLRDRISAAAVRDTEFKAAAARFMDDFDAMMASAMAGDGRNTLAVTLISSEMGRLYVTLTQNLRKPN